MSHSLSIPWWTFFSITEQCSSIHILKALAHDFYNKTRPFLVSCQKFYRVTWLHKKHCPFVQHDPEMPLIVFKKYFQMIPILYVTWPCHIMSQSVTPCDCTQKILSDNTHFMSNMTLSHHVTCHQSHTLIIFKKYFWMIPILIPILCDVTGSHHVTVRHTLWLYSKKSFRWYTFMCDTTLVTSCHMWSVTL
jgi:hypothetical protein